MVVLGEERLSEDQVFRVVYENEQLVLSETALRKVYASFYFLKEFSKDKLIYGINTGFGPMAQYRINHKDQLQLQYNLIRSHCSGSGKVIDSINIRALMLARLNTLLQGYSGVHPKAVELLAELINAEVYPVIYEHGGLGASGDLVQLAHLALSLIGEGEVIYKGVIKPTADVFNTLGILPLEIHLREGLSIMNGTSAMTGIGAVNIAYAQNLLHWAIAASSIIVEICAAYDDPYSVQLNSVKKHIGQSAVAAEMMEYLSNSALVKRREEHLYDKHVQEDVLKEKVQEYYSIRCVPQILGPVWDTILYSQIVVFNEINSVNDNPVIDYENKNVYHGGNFHGDYVALEMDKLKLAITKLSMLVERQLNYLLNDKLNNKLPPFVNMGILGLNLGSQGMQFTATSTVAENQSLSNSVYIHSIPSNNDNQDIVSMGTNAALMTQKVILNSYEVLAIHMITIAQAVDYLDCKNDLSPLSLNLYQNIRNKVASFTDDTVRYPDIKKVRDLLLNTKCKTAS